MTEEKPVSRLSRLLKLLAVMLVATIVGFFLLAFPFLIQFVWALATGWFRHLLFNGPHWDFDFLSMSLSLISAGVGLWLLKRFIEGVRDAALCWPNFLRTAGVVAACTAGAIAMTGIVHEFVWLTKGPILVSYSRSSLVTSINNGKQTGQALIFYSDDFGALPPDLEELYQRRYIDTRSILFFRPTTKSRVLEPWLYLQAGKKLEDLDGEAPLLIGYDEDSNKGVVIRVNNAAETVSRDEYLEILASVERGDDEEN